MSNRGMRINRVFWRFNIFAVALLVALFVGVPILPYGLELPGSVIFPLALTIAALFAAICASWVGTVLAPDHTRTHLLSVVGISIATAAFITLIEALTALTGRSLIDRFVIMLLPVLGDPGEIIPFTVPVIIVALSASWATSRLRSSRDRVGREAMLTLVLASAVFCIGQLPEIILSLSAMFGILPESIQNFIFSHLLLGRVYIYILGLSVANWVSIASVAVGLTLGMWRLRSRGDRLGLDAAITLCLVGLTPLLTEIAYALYQEGFLGLLR